MCCWLIRPRRSQKPALSFFPMLSWQRTWLQARCDLSNRGTHTNVACRSSAMRLHVAPPGDRFGGVIRSEACSPIAPTCRLSAARKHHGTLRQTGQPGAKHQWYFTNQYLAPQNERVSMRLARIATIVRAGARPCLTGCPVQGGRLLQQQPERLVRQLQ